MAASNGNGMDLGYFAVSPEGKRVPINRSVFEALQKFIEDRKQGSVTINFISGGVRGVRDETVYS